jgi:hypothetical protein
MQPPCASSQKGFYRKRKGSAAIGLGSAAESEYHCSNFYNNATKMEMLA